MCLGNLLCGLETCPRAEPNEADEVDYSLASYWGQVMGGCLAFEPWAVCAPGRGEALLTLVERADEAG